nr:MAG TPA: hyaluronidase [Caudoviricetes sp.]
MAIQLQLRNGTIQEWEEANPVLAEGELGVVLEPSGGFVIGDGKNPYKNLPFHPWAQDAYDILVTYGGYKGTKEDFCRQLGSSLRMPEQQAGTFANAGSGWNSYTFPKEFSEDVYVVLTPQDAAVFASVKNVTKQGFHYCLFNAAGDTIAENVVVGYMATAVSELNLAQAIAKASGLNPFDFDNLTDLFTGHAAEVVADEAAFNLVKRSAMASSLYICHLAGLNPDSYFNMVSIAGDVTAMNTVAKNPEVISYIQTAPGAYDSIRLGTMPMAKYLCGILEHEPENYSTVTNILEDEELLAELVLSEAAMTALCGSSISTIELAASDVAMQAVAASDVACDAIFENDGAFTIILESPVAMGAISDSEPAITNLIQSKERCDRLASSETAMSAVAASETAMTSIMLNEDSKESFFGWTHAVGLGLATLFGINNSALKSCNTIVAVAASATAMQAVAASATAISILTKSSVAKDKLTAQNEILQGVRLTIWNTVKADTTRFTLSRAQKDDDGVTSANITGANYLVFAIPGSYGSAAESKKTTMFHGHNNVQVVQRWGAYTDESFIYVGLGGATFTEQGDGMVRTWVYTVN